MHDLHCLDLFGFGWIWMDLDGIEGKSKGAAFDPAKGTTWMEL